MRVAVVLPEVDPRSGGGFTFQESLAGVLESIATSRHEFIMYTRAGSGSRTVRLPHGRRALAARRLTWLTREAQQRALGIHPATWRTWFERSLEAHQIDLVWFGTPHAEDCGGRPYVLTIWDLQYLDQPWFPEVSANGEWELRHAFYSRYIPKATRVIVPNSAGREEVIRHFHLRPERVLVLPHPTPGFAIRMSGQPLRPREVITDLGVPGRYLFYPAQYWPHKNHSTLLEALVHLPEYGLVCVGSDKGSFENVEVAARRLGVTDRVHHLGFVATDELAALYQHAHALVYLSFFGPENLPPLEALAFGCPVIQADVPGAAEQLGEAGIRVPPTDASAVVGAVRRLENPRQREELLRQGRLRATAFTAEHYVDGVVEFLDDFDAVRRCWA